MYDEEMYQELNHKNEKKEKKKHPIMKKLGILIGSGAVFGLVGALCFVTVIKVSGISFSTKTNDSSTATDIVLDNKNASDSNKIPSTNTTVESGIPSGTVLNVSQIAKDCTSSIVAITNKGVEEVRSMFGTQQYEATSVGSGIIIGQNDTELLIATNNHVVSSAEELTVCFGDDENKVAPAKVKGTDSGNDLAIIAVNLDELSDEIKNTITVAKLGNSAELTVGEQVVAIGNALGYGQSVTTGIVSALDREVSIESTTANLIQTDSAINPGNSGGALFNMQGEVIGINSSKFASTQVEGMGYAIPISYALPILTELMERETRDIVPLAEQGVLGISCQTVSSELSEMYNIPKGVCIASTQSGSAAEKAGLKKGDIITKLSNISLESADELKKNLAYYKAGEEVEVTVQRPDEKTGYSEVTVKVTLDKNEDVTTNTEQNQNNSNNKQQNPFSFYFGNGQNGQNGLGW